MHSSSCFELASFGGILDPKFLLGNNSLSFLVFYFDILLQ